MMGLLSTLNQALDDRVVRVSESSRPVWPRAPYLASLGRFTWSCGSSGRSIGCPGLDFSERRVALWPGNNSPALLGASARDSAVVFERQLFRTVMKRIQRRRSGARNRV